LSNGESFKTKNVIWAAGVNGNLINGIPIECYNKATRLIVDDLAKVKGCENIYAIGDTSVMESNSPKGHPQVAQVAIQQAKNLAKNLVKNANNPFKYKDYGSLATIGRNKAVADLPQFKTQGFFAWVMWLFVHVFQIIGLKNKLFIFFNWAWSYVTYDQSLRLLIKPFSPKVDE
jgi:NADH dehydrogenase